MRRPARPTHGAGPYAGLALLCTAAVAAALVSQHGFGLQPCPWCVLQRVILVAIAGVCIVAALWRSTPGRTVAAVTVLALALCGAAAALWQHFRAAASVSCTLTLADRIVGALRLDAALPEVFEPRASCADAAVKLFGLPYDFWSLGLFVVIAGAAVVLLRRPRR